MTREEALEIINGFQAGRIDVDNHAFYHALDFVVDLLESQSSEPKGLDEAAEKIANEHGFVKHPSCKPAKYSYQAVRDVFIEAAIAGAKWMAEQGVTVEGKFHRSCGYPSVIELNTYLQQYDGDKVIVQIRKKEE